MSFDHLRLPLSVIKQWGVLSSSARALYVEIASFYSQEYHISFPTRSQLAVLMGVDWRQVARLLRELESQFFTVRDTLGRLAQMQLIGSFHVQRSDKPAYLLPDFLLLSLQHGLEKNKLEGTMFRLLQRGLILFQQGGVNDIQGCHRSQIRVTFKAPEGGHPRHLNYILEQYTELERIFIKKAEMPTRRTTLTIEESKPGINWLDEAGRIYRRNSRTPA